MMFSLLILFLSDKIFCTVLKTAFEFFSVVTKNRCHLRHHTSKKTQKYLYNGTNITKNFLQLRCFNVLLHLKYQVPFCELNIEFKKVAGGKAIATDHRVDCKRVKKYETYNCLQASKLAPKMGHRHSASSSSIVAR